MSTIKGDESDEVVCILRYQKEQFIQKGTEAVPLATEYHWNGNRIPIPHGASCRVIQTMVKASY